MTLPTCASVAIVNRVASNVANRAERQTVTTPTGYQRRSSIALRFHICPFQLPDVLLLHYSAANDM
jgi:hypothetical protein